MCLHCNLHNVVTDGVLAAVSTVLMGFVMYIGI